jgi:hypothetical protein
VAKKKSPGPAGKKTAGAAGRTNRTRPRRSAPDWAPRFLERLAQTANIHAACLAAGVGRQTVYDRRNADADFARAMAEALEDACDLLEAEARRRAHDGVDEPVIYKGEPMGAWVDQGGAVVGKDTPGARLVPLTVKRHSDALLLALLKAHRPQLYRDNVRHEHTGAGGQAIRHEHRHSLSDEQFAALSTADKVRWLRSETGLPEGGGET